jgi:hypothetical protein
VGPTGCIRNPIEKKKKIRGELAAIKTLRSTESRRMMLSVNRRYETGH